MLQFMQQSVEIEDIRAFVALADNGSFSAAGRMLHRDPTIISRRIAAIEAKLGVRLAERTTRRVRLTEAGEVYLARVRPLLAEFAAAEREAAAHATGEPRGHLRVSLPAAFGRLWLSSAISGFLLRYPHVTIEAAFSNRFVDLVGEGFDVAVRLGTLSDSRLIARRVAGRRRTLVASPSYLAARGMPERPEDLTNHACLRFSQTPHPHIWTFSIADGTQSVVVDGPLLSDDPEVLLDAAVAGLGIAFSGDWLVAQHVSDGRLVPLLTHVPLVDEGAVYIVTPSRDGMPSKTRAFIDYITASLADAPWQAKV